MARRTTSGSGEPDLRAVLVERLRGLLADEPSTREVSMFGSLAFMVNGKMVGCALKQGDLLVRVAADRHGELVDRPGAAQADMAGRDMGPGWITVSADSIDDDAALAWWLDAALAHNRASTGGGVL